MKIKCRPEDFQVEELASLRRDSRGPCGLYLLEKRNLATFEAISRLARHIGRPPRTISAGGLKDKHALTWQHLTIAGAPVGEVKVAGMHLKPLGRTAKPITGADLKGNRFTLTLRDIPESETELISERLRFAARHGVPNYFDEQRFGSLRGRHGFIARKLIDGDYEQALRMHLGCPGRLDSSRDRNQRKRVDQYWGNWQKVFESLPRSNQRSVVSFLRDHPQSFRKAFELIEPRLAQLYLFAYQSYIWNEAVASALSGLFPPEALFSVKYAAGRLLFPDTAGTADMDALRDAVLQMPSRKSDFGDGVLARAMKDVLQAENLSLDSFRLRGMKKLYFRGGSRAVNVFPAEVWIDRAMKDDLYPRSRKLRVSFSLPPGSYATIIIKFIGRDQLPGTHLSRGTSEPGKGGQQ